MTTRPAVLALGQHDAHDVRLTVTLVDDKLLIAQYWELAGERTATVVLTQGEVIFLQPLLERALRHLRRGQLALPEGAGDV